MPGAVLFPECDTMHSLLIENRYKKILAFRKILFLPCKVKKLLYQFILKVKAMYRLRELLSVV